MLHLCCLIVSDNKHPALSKSPCLDLLCHLSSMQIMGTFTAVIELADSEGTRWEPIEALVDTGASYTWVPSDILFQLGVQPQFRREFATADGRVIERDMAVALAHWDGQTLPTLVVFGGDGALPLFGAYTLEGFGLAPDPVNRRLVPVRGFATAAPQHS